MRTFSAAVAELMFVSGATVIAKEPDRRFRARIAARKRLTLATTTGGGSLAITRRK